MNGICAAFGGRQPQPKKIGAKFASCLAPARDRGVGIARFPDVPEVVEDGNSFAPTPRKRPPRRPAPSPHWVLGEDSGLEVAALTGAPGIYSARYSGPDATDESNNAKLLERTGRASPPERRNARYVCNVASPTRRHIVLQLEAYCRGRITTEARGTNGFGYDPYFSFPNTTARSAN